MANYFKETDDWRKRWFVIIGAGLLLESCILLVFLGIWMANRDVPASSAAEPGRRA